MGKYDNVYDDIFQTLRYFHPRLFIPYINQHFGKNYSMDAKIQLAARDGRLIEKNADGSLDQIARESDMIVIIDNDPYLIECQSYNDEMEIRIAEYAFMSAKNRAYKDEQGRMVINMPPYSIIFVRSNSNTPKETKLVFRFPNNQEVEYSCENTLLYDMSKEDIIKNRLYPFIPYYIARYEKLIKDESADISIVLEELQYLYDHVMKWIESGDITNDEANDLKESGRWLIEHIADGNTNQERMVDQMGGRIIITTTQKLLMDKWAEGRAEGRKEGAAERKALEDKNDALEGENARLRAQLAEAGIDITQQK